MDAQFFYQVLGAMLGGMFAWTAIKVEVAIAKRVAEDAKQSAKELSTKLDEHITDFHSK